MAKTYTCDRCGHAETYTNGIIGNEFDHLGATGLQALTRKGRRKFHTLKHAFRLNDWVDVCHPCFDEIAKAMRQAATSQQASVMDRFKKLLTP